MATTQDLSALFKEVYGDKLHDLIPDGTKLLKKIPFRSSEKTGDKYIQPVLLSAEQGFTYNSDGTAFSLNDAETAVMKEAQVDGSELLLRSSISYRHASKAAEKGSRSFAQWTSLVVKNMMNSMAKRLEISMLYGSSPSGIGAVNADPGAASGGKVTFVVSEASFAPGIWSGQEGASLDIYDSSLATQRNNSGTDFKITAVNLDTRSITISGDAGDLGDIDAADIIYFKGSKASDMSGIDKIVTNTGSLFNIDASNYALWSGSSSAVGGALTFSKMLKGVSKAVAKGLDEDVICVVNPEVYESLNSSDVAANRSYDKSYSSSKSENGSEGIVYHGQNGKIEVVPSIYCKLSEGFIIPVSSCKRVGSTDVTFRLPGKSDEEIFLQLSGAAGYELRSYSDQGLFCDSPSKLVKLTGITV